MYNLAHKVVLATSSPKRMHPHPLVNYRGLVSPGILGLIWVPNLGLPQAQEHPCPLSPDLGLWRTLEVPDWG